MVPDFAHVGFTAEIPLPNQGFPARFLADLEPVRIDEATVKTVAEKARQ